MNIARDTLQKTLKTSTSLVPATTRDLAVIAETQTALFNSIKAQNGFRDSISDKRDETSRKIKGRRNFFGVFAALAGGLAFLNENSSDFLYLVLFCAFFGIIAYFLNSIANDAERRISSLKTHLMNDVRAKKIVRNIFKDRDFATRIDIVDSVNSLAFRSVTPFFPLLDLGLGLDELVNELAEDYVDYLENSGFIVACDEMSGEIYRASNNQDI